MKRLKQQPAGHSDTSYIDNIFTHFYMLPKHKQNGKYNLDVYKSPKYTDNVYKSICIKWCIKYKEYM